MRAAAVGGLMNYSALMFAQTLKSFRSFSRCCWTLAARGLVLLWDGSLSVPAGPVQPEGSAWLLIDPPSQEDEGRKHVSWRAWGRCGRGHLLPSSHDVIEMTASKRRLNQQQRGSNWVNRINK